MYGYGLSFQDDRRTESFSKRWVIIVKKFFDR